MIELRDLRPDDAAGLYAWRLDPDVRRWMSDAEFPDEAAHRAWVDEIIANPAARAWLITRDQAPAGLLTLTRMNTPHNRAAWNWLVGDAESRGRGVGRAAQVLGLDRAFGELGLHKVFAEVLADNDAALKAMSAAGFRREGYLPQHVLMGGQPRDVVLLGMTAAMWGEEGAAIRRPLVEARLIPQKAAGS
jgi:UDP-4-amino-4,6-dideoxy-N-acetyl-beta-L-altrosamine N-acetyltransferase